MVMPRELLKFREGDCGLKIRKDGKLEVAGVDDSGGMINQEGRVNPALLFAAAWARRDPKVFELLVQNFKESVREGFFGQEAKVDYERALKVQEEHTKSLEEQNVAVKSTTEPVLDPDSKPTVSTAVYGDEFETSSSKDAATMSRVDAASGAVTFEQPAPLTDGGCGNADSASGAVTFEQPKPYDVNGMLKGRDS
jgi:hypothetical protein